MCSQHAAFLNSLLSIPATEEYSVPQCVDIKHTNIPATSVITHSSDIIAVNSVSASPLQ
jgi:hypothetical protein